MKALVAMKVEKGCQTNSEPSWEMGGKAWSRRERSKAQIDKRRDEEIAGLESQITELRK